ncbi:MAG: hypothetical protein JSW49_02955 [candidate division WOR-3 bacterium]|nr:MAG: hypothetical protein JSW49_02955 [candidate division WOR-3 bacterium]
MKMVAERIVSVALLVSILLLHCREEALEVAIIYPDHGSVVEGIVRVETETSDKVRCVIFYVDDACIDSCRAAPFLCCWNTFVHSGNSVHHLYAIAQDFYGNEICSDSVQVIVDNGDIVFADDFEPYPPHTYPDAAWFEIWLGAGSEHTYVDEGVANKGLQSIRLRGLASWVRTDGVELNVDGLEDLSYELSVMIPSADSTGAMFGFFCMVGPQVGTIYNGVWFRSEDNSVYARGILETYTGCTWRYDTWHRVRVALDYDQLRMNVWFDDEQIVFDLPAAPREWTDTFALATEYGSAGVVYYDDVSVSE